LEVRIGSVPAAAGCGPPPGQPARPRVLVRADTTGTTHAVLDWLAGRRSTYRLGSTLPTGLRAAARDDSERVWAPAYDGDGQVRDAAGSPRAAGCSTPPRGRAGCG
jgi:hypothetical protein